MCVYMEWLQRDGSKSETRERAQRGKAQKRPQSGGLSEVWKERAQQMMSVDVNEYCSHIARKLKAPPEVAIFVRAVKAAVVIPYGGNLAIGCMRLDMKKGNNECRDE